MAQLTRITYAAVKGVDRGALVIGPAFASRIAEQTRGMGFFYYYRFPDNRVPVWHYMDAISLNLYPKAFYGSKAGTPETSMALLAAARTQMRLRGVPDSKPIWNTEINYGLESGGTGASNAISYELQASYVLRTYLLNAANGIKRVHWYAWDKPSLGNTKMSFASTGGPTLAGKAFGLAQSWLSGAQAGRRQHVGQAVRQGQRRHVHLRHQVRQGRPPRVLEPEQESQGHDGQVGDLQDGGLR